MTLALSITTITNILLFAFIGLLMHTFAILLVILGERPRVAVAPKYYHCSKRYMKTNGDME
jgi:hypothetical protein